MGLFKSCKSTLIGEGVSGTVSLCERNDQLYVVKKYRSKENYETRKSTVIEYYWSTIPSSSSIMRTSSP